jgi:hypothetical protein
MKVLSVFFNLHTPSSFIAPIIAVASILRQVLLNAAVAVVVATHGFISRALLLLLLFESIFPALALSPLKRFIAALHRVGCYIVVVKRSAYCCCCCCCCCRCLRKLVQ